jgi:hypothetical protein
MNVASEGSDPTISPKDNNLGPKVTVSIFGPTLSFPVIIRLSPRTKFTAVYFWSDIIYKMVGRIRFYL